MVRVVPVTGPPTIRVPMVSAIAKVERNRIPTARRALCPVPNFKESPIDPDFYPHYF